MSEGQEDGAWKELNKSEFEVHDDNKIVTISLMAVFYICYFAKAD